MSLRASATLRTRTVPKRNGRIQHHSPLVPSLRQISRPYSEAATATPEAPEYLSEGELKIFETIKQELQPTQLEVGPS